MKSEIRRPKAEGNPKAGNCSGVGQTSGLPVHGVSDSVLIGPLEHRARDPADRQTGGPMPLGFDPHHPGGIADNSPTFQCWVREFRRAQVPKGRLKPCAIRQPSSPPLIRYGLDVRIFRGRSVPYGTTERPVVLQSQRDCVLQPRVAESAKLPWVSVRAIFNPNDCVPTPPSCHNPTIWGCPTPPAFPRVARSGSQPWALGRNPFGILGNSRKALSQILADRNVRAPSPRGYCRTERRKDRWFGNPKGIVSSSPGLPSPRGYPGIASVRFSTGLCPLSATGPQPRWGWPTPPALPRVARGSQPWAWGRNPFGILVNSR